MKIVITVLLLALIFGFCWKITGTNTYSSNKSIVGVILSIILFVAFVFGLSWIATCGIVKVISMCFGFTFTWKLATGIWIVCLLLRWIISAAKSDKK